MHQEQARQLGQRAEDALGAGGRSFDAFRFRRRQSGDPDSIPLGGVRPHFGGYAGGSAANIDLVSGIVVVSAPDIVTRSNPGPTRLFATDYQAMRPERIVGLVRRGVK